MEIFRKVDQSSYSSEMPEYPTLVLLKHLAYRGMQVGAVVGLLSVPPLKYLKKKWTVSYIFRTVVPAVSYGMGVGAMAIPYAKGLDADGIDDRAYRLAHNEKQNRLDFYSTWGLAIGASAATLLKFPIAASGTAGVAASILFFGLEETGAVENIKAAVG
jgi:hypothetical protein